MASTVLRCDYPGCDTELKPLFSSMYCPNEDNHGKAKPASAALYDERKAIQTYGWNPFTAFLPACTHHSTVTMNGVTKCLVCGEELTTPYP